MSCIDVDKIMAIYEEIENAKPKKIAKLKKIKGEVEDWTKLRQGNVVKSVRGSGPYFINYYGKKIYKGEYGYYEIDSVDYNGLHVYEYSPHGKVLYHGGRRFIYMGPTEKVDIMNRAPHKLILVK